MRQKNRWTLEGVCVSSGKEQLSSVTARWRVQAHDLVPLGFMRLGTSGREPWIWGSWDLFAMAADHREPVEGNSHYLPPLHLAYKKTVKWHSRLIYWYLWRSVPICLLESPFAVKGIGSVPLEMLGRRQGLVKITWETPTPPRSSKSFRELNLLHRILARVHLLSLLFVDNPSVAQRI